MNNNSLTLIHDKLLITYTSVCVSVYAIELDLYLSLNSIQTVTARSSTNAIRYDSRYESVVVAALVAQLILTGPACSMGDGSERRRE